MAQTLQIRRSATVTVGTNVLKLNGVDDASSVIIWSTTVALLLCHSDVAGYFTDGAAVPAAGLDARPIPSTSVLTEVELPARVFLGIAATGAGTCVVEFVK